MDEVEGIWKNSSKLTENWGQRSREIMRLMIKITQSVFTCSNLTVEALEQGVKYVQS